MSRMYMLRRTRGVGDPAFPLIGGLAKLLPLAGKLIGIGGASAAASKATTALMTRKALLPTVASGTRMIAGGAAVGGGMTAAQQLLAGASSPAFRGGRRRGRGITANELRGFNKVANLLRRVGMVPKATRRAVRRGR